MNVFPIRSGSRDHAQLPGNLEEEGSSICSICHGNGSGGSQYLLESNLECTLELTGGH